jgi:hypothetical protein
MSEAAAECGCVTAETPVEATGVYSRSYRRLGGYSCDVLFPRQWQPQEIFPVTEVYILIQIPKC